MTQLTRRVFCCQTAACLTSFAFANEPRTLDGYALAARTDRARIIAAAARYLDLQPLTITSYPSSRSPGGLHDYFSQADYFWPNPDDPNGKYINRDGQSNPDNFNDHRKAMIALSIQVPALTAAWALTGNRRYGQHAADHLRAWFIDPNTRMNPNLEYSQGVHGVSTGRSYGIIDTLHLVEVARAASILSSALLSSVEQQALQDWFRAYLHWMETSEKGIAERNTLNNHAICWALQAAEFARLIDDHETREAVRTQYKTLFVPGQMALDGSFPRELARTKPYSYSIFNFDTMAALCQSLEGDGQSLYTFALPDGRGICKAAAFLYPYLLDKSTWPYRQDIEHFDSLPVRSPGLLFAGLACNRQDYLSLWTRLNPDPTDPEIIRNFPIRQPLLWVTIAASLRCDGKPEDAIPFCLKAVELNPAVAGNWLELGDCYSLLRGRRVQASKAYSQAAAAQDDELKDDPKNGPGWMFLALCRTKAGAPQTALDLIAKAEQVLAGDLDSQLYKARTLELLGKREDALATVEACLKRGATEFQIRTMPDLAGLRDDPRYTAFLKSLPPANQTAI